MLTDVNAKRMQMDDAQRPLILVTNDDGVAAAGLQALARMLWELGDVVVVAPEVGNSGMSQAITASVPLRYTPWRANTPYDQYAVNGTPADCVKLALHSLVDERPALVAAGINHGSNASVNVLYSGTMGATLEGCLAGIPSIGFSLVNREPGADMEPYLPYCRQIAMQVLQRGLPRGVCLNVNLPRHAPEGVRVCRQARAKWEHEFEERVDPWGRAYHWLTGTFCNLEPEARDTDDYSLKRSFITVVPTRVDMTDYASMEELKAWQWDPNR